MDWINSNTKTPFWPLVVSVSLHTLIIIVIYNYKEPEIASDIPQNVELWAEPEAAHNKIAEQPEKTVIDNIMRPITTQQSDIALPKKLLTQKTVTSSTLVQQNKQLPNAQHLAEEVLAKLNTNKTPIGKENSHITTQLSNMGAYKTKVIHRIRPYINIPINLVGNPTAQVLVRIAPYSMEIIFIKLIKSSGNTEYDQSILRAIQKIGQFPPLPTDADQTLFRSITLTFRPH